MGLNRIIWICVIISISVTLIINIIPSSDFFGAYYIDLYIIIPLFLIQLSTLFFYKRNTTTAIIINVLIALIMIYIAYKFFINR